MKAVISKNDIIKNVFIGSDDCMIIEPTDRIIVVCDNFLGQAGQNIGMYDEHFNLKWAEILISEGYISISSDEKIVDHKVVKKTLQERFDEGIYIPPQGSSVVNGVQYTLEEYRTVKYSEINRAFENMYAIGMASVTLNGGLVDCRRPQFAPYEDDIGNITTLLNVMKANNITTTGYRMRDNSTYPDVTQEMMQAVIDEMGIYGVTQYQKRAQIKDAIISATSFGQLKSIVW